MTVVVSKAREEKKTTMATIPEAKKPSKLQAATNSLQKVIEAQQILLDELQGRLAIILGPTPATDLPQQPELTGGSKHVQDLQDFTQRLSKHNDRIKMLLVLRYRL